MDDYETAGPAGTINVLTKEELPALVAKLVACYTVIGPVAKGGEFVFHTISEPQELALDYVTTLLPPKKVLHQPFETLFSFHDTEGIIEEGQPDRRQVLLGVHPCDVNAIKILDKAYTVDYIDPYYVRKRHNTLLVALNCSHVGENCFCQSMGTGPDLQDGYDLLLTDLGPAYLVEVGSTAGEEFAGWLGLSPAPRLMMVEKARRFNELHKKFKKRMITRGLHDLLEENFRHPVWEELMHECLACGACTMVCPTCFCYNVVDKIDLSLRSGKRQREWDSCMLLEYARVALGNNFRKDRDARIKQRIYHKLVYYELQFDTLGCVGCGRCINTCVKGIDITEIIARIRGD